MTLAVSFTQVPSHYEEKIIHDEIDFLCNDKFDLNESECMHALLLVAELFHDV